MNYPSLHFWACSERAWAGEIRERERERQSRREGKRMRKKERGREGERRKKSKFALMISSFEILFLAIFHFAPPLLRLQQKGSCRWINFLTFAPRTDLTKHSLSVSTRCNCHLMGSRRSNDIIGFFKYLFGWGISATWSSVILTRQINALNFFKDGPTPASFSFISVFWNRKFKCLAGFKLRLLE